MRRVVITGGGTGIGRAVASAFARSEEEAEVVVTGRRAKPLDEVAAQFGSIVRGVSFDAADPAQVERALAELPDKVDVLVNAAGGNTDIGAAEPTNLSDLASAWRANLDSNLISAVLMTAALRDRLAPGGAVINFSSIAARRGGAGSYAAAKAAIESWNLTLARELGADGITANVIAPGFIEGTEFFRGRMTDARRSALIAQTANGRAGTVDDIAAVALFLASPSASHVTGQTIHVNGGALS